MTDGQLVGQTKWQRNKMSKYESFSAISYGKGHNYILYFAISSSFMIFEDTVIG